jgi:membrane protease subunit (stomatin/prohibitin family)
VGILNEARREFIAAPDSAKGQIVYKWPDQNIRKYTKAIVEPDAAAVFTNQGQVVGVLPPGQHRLDATEIPFLGMFVDWASNSNAFKAEIYFVGAREFPGCRFGGRLDDVQDPVSGLVVTLRTFGEYALRVTEPTKLIFNLVGSVDVTNNGAITDWVAQQLLKVTRTVVTTQLMAGAWPILGLSVRNPEIEAAALPATNEQLASYGLAITRFGNLDVNLSDEDSARLKKLAGDTAYSRLAGGFLQAAQAEALQGAGEGMAQGGAAATPLFLGAGFGVANQMMQPPPQAPPQPPPAPGFAGGGPGYMQPASQPAAPAAPQVPAAAEAPAAGEAPAAAPQAAPPAGTVDCGNCHSQVRAGAKFCDMCGTPMQKHCTNCNADLSASAKFCAECGTPVSPPA